MIAFDQGVPPLSVDVPDAVEMWVMSMIDIAIYTSICLRLVGHNCHRTMQSNAFHRFVAEAFRSFGVPPRGEANIHHLVIGVDGSREMPPLANNVKVGLVNMQDQLARRKCFSVRLVIAAPALITQR